MISFSDLPRIFFGLYMLYSGLNGFFNFRPLPPTSEKMQKFVAALLATEIILPIVKLIEVICGALLVLGLLQQLCLLLFAPIVFFISLAQLRFNRPQGYLVSAIVVIPYLMAVYVLYT